MTDRKKYFDSINSNHSPILQFTDRFDQLLKASESNSIEDLLFYASYLESSDTDSVKARGTLSDFNARVWKQKIYLKPIGKVGAYPSFRKISLQYQILKTAFYGNSGIIPVRGVRIRKPEIGFIQILKPDLFRNMNFGRTIGGQKKCCSGNQESIRRSCRHLFWKLILVL